MVLMPLLSRLLTLLVILTMPLFLARLTLIPIKSLSICFRVDRKSGSAGMPRPSSYAVFCLKKKTGGRGGPEVVARIVDEDGEVVALRPKGVPHAAEQQAVGRQLPPRLA